MCGRFTLRTPADILAEMFTIDERPNLAARFNIAPGQDILAVRQSGGDGARGYANLRWGLTPPWAKDGADSRRMINARAETLADKPSFREAFRHRRCLIPADGYYEWQKAPDGTTQPFHIRRDDGAPFAMAGLWESRQMPDGETLESCVLITTAANRALEPIHHRMPAILPVDAYDAWLDEQSGIGHDLSALLRPYPHDDLAAHAVGPHVNNARHDDAACLEPAVSRMLL